MKILLVFLLLSLMSCGSKDKEPDTKHLVEQVPIEAPVVEVVVPPVVVPPVVVPPVVVPPVVVPQLRKVKGIIPDAAYKYRRMLIRIVQAEHGLNAPLAMYSAQIHKESTWREDVCSAYACGLTQFTESTAVYVGEKFAELGPGDVMNPAWAIKAQSYYNQHLFRHSRGKDDCESWAKTLSAYNGGIGWLRRDEKETEKNGYDRTKWWGNVEVNKDPRRRDSAVKENTNYPIRILLDLQLLYHQEGFVEGPLVCRSKLLN